jgi:glycosyltransferase involved in cell wall biosynthesis
LESSCIVLFPYDVTSYRKRTSGVFSEAVACGKIVVAPKGTWMAQKLEEDRAAGAIFDDPSPASIAEAIGRCVRDVDRLARLAGERSAAWGKEYGLCAFIDFMERQVALRQASAAQAS